MTVFLDTCVLFAITKPSEVNHAWAVEQFEHALTNSAPVIITDIVFCEFGYAMGSVEEVSRTVRDLGIARYRTRDEMLFRAVKAFKDYKEVRKGPKLGVLPDFLIGAAAEIAKASLITTNPRDFVTMFPNVHLIQPPPKAAGPTS